jgi:uncharacterized protein (TIGR02246 family)
MALAVGTLSLGCASTRADQATTATMTNNGFDKNPHPGANNVNAEIQALMRTYQRSLNEADVALVRSVYADDAIFIGQPFPTATGIDAIAALYADFLSKMDFDVEFEILEVELGDTVGFVRTQSLGTIVPKGQTPAAKERNREVFVVKKIEGAWKFYRYIFNSEV